MNWNKTNGASPVNGQAVLFDHEKLDVYGLELQFIAWVTPLLKEVSSNDIGRTREVCDQLDRASLSILLNTAEGNGKRQRQVRAKFFDDARGSATECAACLDALVAKRVTVESRIVEGKKKLLRIVSMLCGLVDRFDSSAALHDEVAESQMEKPPVKKINYRSGFSRTRTRTRTKENI
jgi:four helix bundle protein